LCACVKKGDLFTVQLLECTPYQQAKYSILHKLKTPKGAHIQAVVLIFESGKTFAFAKHYMSV
jgi:hypothetical protein